MKRIFALFLCLLCLAGCTSGGDVAPETTAAPTFTVPTTAETTAATEPESQSVTPLFWHVTGKNGAELWLLGTIHVGDERTENLPWQITTALESADALAVECDVQAAMEDVELMVDLSMMMMYDDGTGISDHLSPTLYEQARQVLEELGVYAGYCDYLKPMAWYSLITEGYTAAAGLDSEAGVDMQLLALAEEERLEIREIESVTAQYELLFGFSEEIQALLLEETVSVSQEEYTQDLRALMDAWCRGDEETLLALVSEEPEEELDAADQALYDEYYDAMYTQRNQLMIDTAISYLEAGDKVFYAVGAAHMLGEDGIIAALEQAGYTVELISFD